MIIVNISRNFSGAVVDSMGQSVSDSSLIQLILLKIYSPLPIFSSVQFCSVAQSCPTLCDPMNRSKPGLPVHHQLLEFTETHVHRVSDAI